MTNQHDGVSCDACLQSGFRGKRYKCLICYDFDLCSACYEAGIVKQQHTKDHPMQCILSRAELELYYGGETLTNPEHPQSYTCPYCSQMGFSQATLEDHVTKTHSDNPSEVICPICATVAGGDPNRITDDLVRHLTLDHRAGPRDLMPFLDDGIAIHIHDVRRAAYLQPQTPLASQRGRTRPRRPNMQLSTALATRASLRDPVDPIAELLSHLSGVRRSSSNTNSGVPNHFQQLQMQWHLDRHVHTARQQLERLSQRHTRSHSSERKPNAAATLTGGGGGGQTPAKPVKAAAAAPAASTSSSNFLLAKALNESSQQNVGEDLRRARSRFIQQLILSTMSRQKSKPSKEISKASGESDDQNTKTDEVDKIGFDGLCIGGREESEKSSSK